MITEAPHDFIDIHRLDKDMKKRIQRLAAARKRTSHWIMPEVLAHYVEREEKLELLLRDTPEAREEFQKTGLHATAEDVVQWLARWGTEDETLAPERHK